MINDREFYYKKNNEKSYSLFCDNDLCIGEINILDKDIVFNPININYKIYDFTSIELMEIIKIMLKIKLERVIS